MTSNDPGRGGKEMRSGTPLKFHEVFQQELEAIDGADLAREIAAGCTATAGEEGHERVTRCNEQAHRIKPWALCLSGGGIRSASFNLGVLQALAQSGKLDQFHYLSTVSGGGYIGAWLSAMVKRAGTLSSALHRLLVREGGREPEALEHLRDYSNFIAPKVGLLSADNWTFAATYLRNLLLNWTVLVPLLLAVLLVPRLAVAILRESWPQDADWLLPTVAAIAAIVSVMYMTLCQSKASHVISAGGFWQGRRSGGHFVRWCLIPMCIATILLSWWAYCFLEGLEWRHLLYGAGVGFAGVLAASLATGKTDPLDAVSGVTVGALTVALSCVVANAFFPMVQTLGQREHLIAFVCLFGPCVLVAFLLSGSLLIALTSNWKRVQEEDREWHARLMAHFLIAATAWLGLCALALVGPIVAFHKWKLSFVWGTISTLAGTIAASGPWSPGAARPNAQPASSTAPLTRLLVPIVCVASLIAIAIGLSLATTAIFGLTPASRWILPADWTSVWRMSRDLHWESLRQAGVSPLGILLAGLLVLSLVMSAVLNRNRFSLHAAYRSRLVRAFLGASRKRAGNPFTGFDPEDDFRLPQLHPYWLIPEQIDFAALAKSSSNVPASLVSLSGGIATAMKKGKRRQFAQMRDRYSVVNELNKFVREEPDGWDGPRGWKGMRARREQLGDALREFLPQHALPDHWRLFPVINVAMNLDVGSKFAWQQRKAVSFTFTPLSAGARDVYQPAATYGRDAGVSLGMAMTISGAAASPNMGYYTSSSLVSFLMTLFNVRLGWWIENPGFPRSNVSWGRKVLEWLFFLPVRQEAFGLANESSSFVCLSDGGHFDNLGLYEMVRRRCHLIVLGDAGGDQKTEFAELGRSIRKIRIDFGIEIERLDAAEDAFVRRYAIRYGRVDGMDKEDGTLIVIKPIRHSNAPADVQEYANAHPAFPQESTLDQFFSEAQFESYRKLGSYLTECVLKRGVLPVGDRC